MIGKNRVNVFVNVAVQQRVVLYCVEDAIYKSSNVDAQVDSYVLRRGSLTRDDTRWNFREDGRVLGRRARAVGQ